MMGRIVYVIGPSGAGKDTLLALLKESLPIDFRAYFARRSITRPPQTEGEQHESLSSIEFERNLALGAFAMHWRANGLSYGIRHHEFNSLRSVHGLFINGSRQHLAAAAEQNPNLLALHISATEQTLRERLQTRGRETTAAINARIARTATLSIPDHIEVIEISNDGSLQSACDELVSQLKRAFASPSAC